MKIDSTLITLKDVIEEQYFFNIPIYQRLYVWENNQIKTLLEDIEIAFDDKKDIFYLGGVLVVENECLTTGKVFDLIDGQQRFTTLWMIAIVFSDVLKPFIERYEKEKNRHRVTFAIRDDIYRFFKDYINGDTNAKSTSHIENALALICSFKKGLETKSADRCNKIAAFIMEKVKLIFTEVHKKTDLNKLFEIINNRGIQLQHHEILKAHFLNILESDDRLKYSYLWDACSYMESYVEKNIRDIAKIRIQDLFDNEDSKIDKEKLFDPKIIIQSIEKRQSDEFNSLSLSNILTTDNLQIEETSIEDEEDYEYESDEVRSIITFPMLLQHTLRIFLANNNQCDIPKIIDKELLGIFTEYFLNSNKNQEAIKEFIELLWQIRYMFDKHIIKWVRQEDSETHLVCKLYKQENKQRGKTYYTLRRIQPTSNEGESLLQSMLYHSQQITTHYWLTPYLKHILYNKDQSHFEYLMHLDNHLLCSREEGSLVERTRNFLETPEHKTTLSTAILREPKGTSFPHYWFYKLEFILWSKYSANNGDRWKNFKMTAKNSVEHISPQTQKDTDTNTVSEIMLNSFGNLSLVSRSINSEYSNLPFNEKRQHFINNNRVKLDSLKMDLIYNSDIWSDDKAKEHQEQMIRIVNEYLGLKNE